MRSLLHGGSVTLVGVPKIGKSSLLWRLADSWQERLLGHIDLMSIENREDFYESLGDELDLKNGDWRRIREELKTE